jgi:hypothetical protein
MFRTLGLRHLIVVNAKNEVVGIVARAELVESHISPCLSSSRFAEPIEIELSNDM